MEEHYLHTVRQNCPLPPGTHVVASVRDSGGDDQERSTRQQIAVIHEYCAHYNLVLEQIYVDEAKTASNSENRDGLNRMLADLRGRFPQIRDRYRREKQTQERPFGVIFWKSNRLGRDQMDTQFTKTDMRMRGITIVDLVPLAETGNPGMDAMIEAFQAWQDQNLLDEISQNVKRGLADVVRLRDNDTEFRNHNPDWPTNDGRYLGITVGRIPTGFRAEPVQIGQRRRRRHGSDTFEPRIVQRAVPDVESGIWERCYLAWKMRHEGASMNAIWEATRLFSTSAGYSVFFRNRIYTGDFEYGDKLLTNFVPALIPVEWYEEEQKRIQERAAKGRSQKMDPRFEPRRVASRHLLSGLVYCSAIEGEEHPMSADTISAKDGVRSQWDFYICSRKKNSHNTECRASRVGAAALERAVIDKLMSEVLTVENLRPLADDLAHSLTDRNQAVLERMSALQSHLSEVRASVSKLLDAVERAGWSPNLKNRLAEREAEERDLLSEIATYESLLVEARRVQEISTQQLEEFIAHMRATLMSDDTGLAREAISRFVAKIVVHGKAGTVYYTFPLSGSTRNGVMPPRGPESNTCWGALIPSKQELECEEWQLVKPTTYNLTINIYYSPAER